MGALLVVVAIVRPVLLRVLAHGPSCPTVMTRASEARKPKNRLLKWRPWLGCIRNCSAARFSRSRAGADTTDFAAECRRWHDAFGPVYVSDPSDASRITTEFCVHQNESPSRFLWRTDQTIRSLGRRWDYGRKASAIRVPTLVIQGDRDLAASPDGARRWTELIPDARLIMLSGAGHLTYIERRDRVIPALGRFLSGSWPGEAMQLRSRTSWVGKRPALVAGG